MDEKITQEDVSLDFLDHMDYPRYTQPPGRSSIIAKKLKFLIIPSQKL